MMPVSISVGLNMFAVHQQQSSTTVREMSGTGRMKWEGEVQFSVHERSANPAVMWLLMRLSPTNPHLKQFEASGVSLGGLLSQRYELRPLSKHIAQQPTARLN